VEATQCAASYGAAVGDPVCCGQSGPVSDAIYICGAGAPECTGFVQGSQWGTCGQPTRCAASYGAKVGDPVCCDQSGPVSDAIYICGADAPVCTGFVQGSQWGTCRQASTGDFPSDYEYGEDGYSLSGGVSAAVERGYSYVAIARSGVSNGHRFSFSALGAEPNLLDSECRSDAGLYPTGCTSNYNFNTCQLHFSVWTVKPSVTVNGDLLQYVGCFSHESAFDSNSRIYGGDGGSLNGGVQAARDEGLPYVAIANNPASGHRFSFRTLSGAPNLEDHECTKGCDGTTSYSACGCADNYNSNTCTRAWAVYRLAAASKETARVCAESEGEYCYCPGGTVYYGKKFVEGQPGSGETTSLAQLKSSPFIVQQGNKVCSSGGGVGMGSDPLVGYFKWCYCVQSQ